jgi:hypothetical protein
MLGILGAKINGVRVPTAVGSLDDNTLHMATTDIVSCEKLRPESDPPKRLTSGLMLNVVNFFLPPP